MGLFVASTLLSTFGAILALLLRRSENAAKVVGCLFGTVAAVASLCAGVPALLGQTSTLTAATPFFPFELLLNQLSGLLVTVISILALAAWIYGFSYFDEYKGKGVGTMCFFMNLFIASMNCVITADNAFWFLVFFEMMSLTSYFLVVTDQDKAALKGGFMYLVMAHVGFFMIMIAFFTMAGITGSFSFSTFRTTAFSPAVASLVFTLAFLGFGVKAGMIPFHSWLPQAHPAAPSNVSALMSGGMIKIGVFGIIKVGFDLLSVSGCQLWWGIMVIIFGAVSSVLGVTYALAEHDIKRLLAYHSVENIGIILMGVGVALVGWAISNPVLTVIGMLAALFHLFNHAMFKGLLFLGAGSILYSAHTRDLTLMGGLAKVMPVTSICFLIGALAISAVPPLNGFVSEWFTYQALITAAFSTGALIKTVCAFAAVMLAITGALAVTCFVKAYGTAFLGDARSDEARAAKEVPGSMKFSMLLLMIICVVSGIGAPWVVPVFENAAASVAGVASVGAVAGTALVNPASGSAMSTPLLAILLLAAIIVPVIICRSSKSGVKTTVDPWACGYLPTDEMPMTAYSFASTVKMFFPAPYEARDKIVATAPSYVRAFTGIQSWADKAQDWGDRCLVDPVKRFVQFLSRLSSKVEGGDFRVYIIYVVVTLVFFLLLAAVMK